MRTLYIAAGNELDSMGYASLNGFTMHRERTSGTYWCALWVLRDPSGDRADSDLYRSELAERNGFELDE